MKDEIYCIYMPNGSGVLLKREDHYFTMILEEVSAIRHGVCIRLDLCRVRSVRW